MIRSNGAGGNKTNDGGMVEVEASDVAVLLCINDGLYMSELFLGMPPSTQLKTSWIS